MNIEHWKQAYDWGKFQAFDYGSAALKNLHYGQSVPPVGSSVKLGYLFACSQVHLID